MERLAAKRFLRRLIRAVDMMISKTKQNGFSYIDVMIAIVILMIGILSMAGALAANLVRSAESEKRTMAKQLALSTIESIMSAKEIEREGVVDGWESLRNTLTSVPPGEINGIFRTGYNPVRAEVGWDGVAGTIDDACSNQGPCVVPDRPINASAIIAGVQREIVITDVPDAERPSPPNPISRRRIDVNIKYFVNQATRLETMSTIITNY
jgi:type II secretory pathway pseudopilin PulG